jgi:hypothetical protein
MLSVTEPPLSLQYGVLIQAKVRALNAFGWSDYSEVNTEGQLTEQKPATPLYAPELVS